MAQETNTREGASPKHVFMYLLMIAMLYVSVVSFTTLIFEYINVLFPDPLNSYILGTYNAIRSSSSALIVAFPVYLLMSWLLRREHARIPETKEMRSRKWLIYFTLFISAVTIIIDLVQLINNFYSGELTVPFTLKVLTVLIVAASVFGYYLWDLHKKKDELPKIKLIAGISSLIVLIAIIAGFFIAGTPQQQRQVRLDAERVNDLQRTQYYLVEYWQKKGTLPESLEDLKDDINNISPPKDPETNTAYVYEKTGDTTFKLCATFGAETPKTSEHASMAKPYYPDGTFINENWMHKKGYICFERHIDPVLHKMR